MLDIRPAKPADLNAIATLLVADARERCKADQGLWRLDPDAHGKTIKTMTAATEAQSPPFRQRWLVADMAGELVGVTHSILLPVPPIYAGDLGPPGLIMEGCYVRPDAPADTHHRLFAAAQDDLIQAGARVLLASSVPGGVWESEYARQGYTPLTGYFAKTGLSRGPVSETIHPATDKDVPDIVASSAVHRRILHDLHHRFWKPHADADARFGAWMQRSLTLEDRDMFVGKDGSTFRGYAISQPATPLHFPTPHDISGIGVIDDFYHDALEYPEQIGPTQAHAAALLGAAEAARAHRGDHSVLVVCPADWQSKVALLDHAGYRTAMTWHVTFTS